MIQHKTPIQIMNEPPCLHMPIGTHGGNRHAPQENGTRCISDGDLLPKPGIRHLSLDMNPRRGRLSSRGQQFTNGCDRNFQRIAALGNQHFYIGHPWTINPPNNGWVLLTFIRADTSQPHSGIHQSMSVITLPNAGYICINPCTILLQLHAQPPFRHHDASNCCLEGYTL